MSNPLLVGGLFGLICGALIISTHHWGFGSEWLRLIVAVALIWLISIPLFGTLGRWHVVSEEAERSPEARKWSLVGGIALAVAVSAVLGMQVCIWLAVRSSEPESYDKLLFVMRLHKTGLLVTGVALVVAAVAFRLRKKALKELQRKQPDEATASREGDGEGAQ